MSAHSQVRREIIGSLEGTFRFVACLVGVFVVGFVSDAVDAQVEGSDPTGHASDHVLVKLEDGIDPSRVLGDHEESYAGAWHSVPVPEGKTPAEFAAELRSEPNVEAAEVDPIVQIEPMPVVAGNVGSVAVNDPDFHLQWHLPAVQAEQAWAESSGAGVAVAVIDTGVSMGGEDLDCHNFTSPYNAITGSTGSVAASDDHGHGTHVAGTIAQCTNNGVGVAGVAFGATLMPVKVLNSSGSGFISDIAEGIEWARAHGAEVINLSLGCNCQATIVDEAIEAAVGDGLVVVAASGNEAKGSVLYPASHPDVIAVGGTGYDNTLAPYSNRGGSVDVVAPGGNLAQDANGDGHPDGVLQETFCDRPPSSCPPSLAGSNGWDYYYVHGTSMATAHVSGAAALLLSKHPGAAREAVRRALQETARDLGPPGFDNSYGHGLIQIQDALAFDLQRPVWSRDASLAVARHGETSLTLAWSPASDNVAVTAYRLRMNGQTVADMTGRNATVSGLQPGTAFDVEVLARDKAGNWSSALKATLRTARAFSDTPGHTFYNDILWMSGMDITRGCNPPENDLFCPDDPVIRGQMAAFIIRALGLTANTHPGFDDVAADSTFAEDIGKLATAGVTRGCNPPRNDRFCPDDSVTRAQMAAFVVRALGLTANTHPGFDDVPASSTFAQDIGKLATAGITRGCNPPTNDLFCPDDPITRGELAAFLHRALGR
jgi:subtilisin family serine protease